MLYKSPILMKKLLVLIFIFSVLISSAQVNSYLRKATRAIENNKLELAKTHYLKAYNLDKTNYETNLGLGFMLSEYMFKYEEALPYLETAYSKTPTDTFPDLIYALAKCHHHIGNYTKAQALFSQLIVIATEDKEQDHQYIIDLKKREEDCVFAEKNKNAIFNKNIYVGNLGPKINSDMPEYVPVINDNNELIFTSRRKDSEKEKRSKIDDKYFESLYVSKLENGRPQTVKTYTVSDNLLKTNYKNKHISIISSSRDGKTLFLFQDNKIHEVKVGADNKKSTKQLSKNVNMDYYQNHASLSKDEKTLLFTSEDDRGNGGLDIYKSVKGNDGNWGTPENLGKTINTEYDEDSPYLSDDEQTLYFSSKGHPGFGNYDIYKSIFVNGAWSQPENLEQPINSPGHDIFLVLASNSDNGYFSSSRTGGFGDMDIYKITYLDKFNKECVEKTSPLLTLNSTLIDENIHVVNFETTIPDALKPIAYQWTFNQTKLINDASQISQNVAYTEIGDSIYVKVIVGCDTCFEPIVLCNYTKYKKPKDEILVSEIDVIGKNPYDDKLMVSYLNKSKLDALGFNLTPIYFNLNKSDVREDAVSILKNNLDILSKHPELSILIYGFADSRGSETYNLPLSKKRAQRVKDYLVSKGLKANQIEQVNGQGERFILNNCIEGVKCEDKAHEQNRRVEFIIFEKKK